MVIYGEILFLENAVTGGLLLWMVRTLCGLVLSRRKLILGAVLCGLYAFTIFQGEVSVLVSLMEKLVFSMVLIRLCFGKQRVILATILFYVLSFLMGGITIGLSGLCSVPAISGNGSFYMDQITYLHIVSGCGATVLCIRLLMELIRDHRHQHQIKRKVTILYKGRKVHTMGFLDTGNVMMDPVSGYPVCVITADLWKELSGGINDLRVTEYDGVSGSAEKLAITGPADLWIEGSEGAIPYRAVLGIAASGGRTQGFQGCRILLNGRFMGMESGEIAG